MNKKRRLRGENMSGLQAKFQAILEDVNQEDGLLITAFGKITDSLFFLIKWGGVPLVLYLLWTVSRW
jgi:hypothetical protein